MAGDLVKVSVSDVRVAVAAGPGVEAGMVTLREDEPPHRAVPIVIGQPEARAIQGAWTGAVQARPSTWDLFIAAMDSIEAHLERVIVTAVEDHRHFFACIDLGSAGQTRSLPARPSDAIALALRADGAEIFVAESVMAALGMPAAPSDEHPPSYN